VVVVVVVVVGGGAHSIATLMPADATSSAPNRRSRVTTSPTVLEIEPVETSPSCRSIGSSEHDIARGDDVDRQALNRFLFVDK
jgi:hypothetical protein